MIKREQIREDGRYVIYYSFRDEQEDKASEPADQTSGSSEDDPKKAKDTR